MAKSSSLVTKVSVQRRRRVHRPRRSLTKPERAAAAAAALSHEKIPLAGGDAAADMFGSLAGCPSSPEYPVVLDMDDCVVDGAVDDAPVAAGRRASDETLAVHAGEKLGSGAAETDSIATPIVSGTTHWFRDSADLIAFREGRRRSFEYGRYGNPTVKNRTALRMARLLEKHPKIERVYYPGLESSPWHGVATRQMAGAGGVVSFEVASDLRGVMRFVDALELPLIATSLGGCESLVQQPAVMSYWGKSEEEKAKNGIKDNFVRFSFGIEKFEDLRDDILQALEKI
uniref:Cystathionine gamma-synthase n=1 Tax=Oryza meridionalis TaxID=40149 RepID=A0A0E0EXG3_9ORYZ